MRITLFALFAAAVIVMVQPDNTKVEIFPPTYVNEIPTLYVKDVGGLHKLTGEAHPCQGNLVVLLVADGYAVECDCETIIFLN